LGNQIKEGTIVLTCSTHGQMTNAYIILVGTTKMIISLETLT